MALTTQRYQELKREVDDAKSAADQARGELTGLMKRLESEFKCGNVKEAQTKLRQLQTKRDTLETRLGKAIADYEEKWKGEA
jgi:predicted  nucleic acid-binding Zn-ribbon protein